MGRITYKTDDMAVCLCLYVRVYVWCVGVYCICVLFISVSLSLCAPVGPYGSSCDVSISGLSLSLLSFSLVLCVSLSLYGSHLKALCVFLCHNTHTHRHTRTEPHTTPASPC